MVNPHRGEVAAILDGRPCTLRLTLGALAELEQTLGAADLGALADHFSGGRIAASDAVAIIGAGLRGAGDRISDAQVAAMTVDGGAAGLARLVAEVLTAAFGPGPGGPAPGGPGPGGPASGGPGPGGIMPGAPS